MCRASAINKPYSALSLDLQQAFDTFNLKFLSLLLNEYRFPNKFLQLLICLQHRRLTMNVNQRKFKQIYMRNGLEQGNPISSMFLLIHDACNNSN